MNHRKKLMCMAFVGMAAIGSMSAKENIDTIGAYDEVKSLTVVRSANITQINAEVPLSSKENEVDVYSVMVQDEYEPDNKVFDEKWGMQLPFYSTDNINNKANSKGKVKRFGVGLQNFYFGWRFNYRNKDNIKNCFEVGVLNAMGIGWSLGEKGPAISTGVGVGMRRFLARDGYYYTATNQALSIVPNVSSDEIKSSRLDVVVFHVPLILKLPIWKSLSFSVGGVVNFNTWASAKTVTQNGERQHSVKYKHLQQNIFTADIFASLTVRGIGVYAEWSPMKLFRNDFGPEARGISIGVTLWP